MKYDIGMIGNPEYPIYWAHIVWEKDRIIERTLAEKPEWYGKTILGNLIKNVDGCEIWQGRLRGGYGSALIPRSIAKYESGSIGVRTHRVRWLAENGPIALGWLPDHLCRTRSCGNIDHLEAVPFSTNILRGEAPSAKNSRKTSCPAGHDLDDPANQPPSAAKFKERACLTCLLKRSHISGALRSEAQKRTGLGRAQFTATHDQSLGTFIRLIGGRDAAIKLIRLSVERESIEVVAKRSGAWADFAKDVMNAT